MGWDGMGWDAHLQLDASGDLGESGRPLGGRGELRHGWDPGAAAGPDRRVLDRVRAAVDEEAPLVGRDPEREYRGRDGDAPSISHRDRLVAVAVAAPLERHDVHQVDAD